jgi:hypothetical protein
MPKIAVLAALVVKRTEIVTPFAPGRAGDVLPTLVT